MQDQKIDDLEQELAELQDELNDLQQRASSRGGKRLAALPGTSIPMNEFDDNAIPLNQQEEEEKRDEPEEESPAMQPRGEHQHDLQIHPEAQSPDLESSPDGH